MEAAVNQLPETKEVITIPQDKELVAEATGALAEAKAFKVANADDYIEAGRRRDVSTERAKFADTLFGDAVSIAHKLHKTLVGRLNMCKEPFVNAAKTYKVGMIAYDENQKRIAEKKRLELEAQERERAKKEQEDVAVLMEEGGLNEQAEEIRAEPIVVAPVVVPKETPRVENFSYRGIWKFRIVNEMKIPREYMIPDQVKIGQLVRALKQATNIPGIEAYEEKV